MVETGSVKTEFEYHTRFFSNARLKFPVPLRVMGSMPQIVPYLSLMHASLFPTCRVYATLPEDPRSLVMLLFLLGDHKLSKATLTVLYFREAVR